METSGNISIESLKVSVRESASTFMNCFNNSIKEGVFPDELKLAEVIPVHKKHDSTDKSNYRPISLLPSVSKVFEKLVYRQLNQFKDSKLSKFLCGFRKGYIQYAILSIQFNSKLEKVFGNVWKDWSSANGSV